MIFMRLRLRNIDFFRYFIGIFVVVVRGGGQRVENLLSVIIISEPEGREGDHHLSMP
jgi:hypothetical protein